MIYGEDIFVGYRYYEAIDLPVRFPFGPGLSYATFSMTELQIQLKGDEISIFLKLTNKGPVYGSEVVQVYVSQRFSTLSRPPKELKGFSKHYLEASRSIDVEIKIPVKYATSFWDEGVNAWTSEAGLYDVLVGNSSQSAEFLRGEFELDTTFSWNGI